MKVVLLSGISGAGKDTYIKHRFGNDDVVKVFSADDYFMSAEGYKFDPSHLPFAHGQCLRNFINTVAHAGPMTTDVVVVNNTNLTTEELAPYVAIASAYEHSIELVTIHCPPHIAAARSLHVNNPSIIKGMHDRLAARKLPPFWKLTQINVEA